MEESEGQRIFFGGHALNGDIIAPCIDFRLGGLMHVDMIYKFILFFGLS